MNVRVVMSLMHCHASNHNGNNNNNNNNDALEI